MTTARWNGAVIAQSDATIVVEGNHYFPPDTVRPAHLRASATHTTCGWKGIASYYDVVVSDAVNRDAAWYYPAPKDAATNIAGYVAFWRGVTVE
jgi:uncharacterized protein (DUF427 family)